MGAGYDIRRMPSSFARPDPLASVGWLAERLAVPAVRVLDCRWRVDGAGQRLYAASHVPGAPYVDWATELVEPSGAAFRLAGPEPFAAVMARAGVDDESTVVVYDDSHSLYAARAWWSLRAYGIESVRVLDGGWPAWVEYGAPTSADSPPAAPAAFTPRLDERLVVSTDEMARLVGSPDTVIIDARTPPEYLGQGGAGPRRGHIPRAVNLPAALLTREGGRFPTPPELGRILAERGVARGPRIVVYDTNGVGAAKLCLCLELLGFDDVALYDPGWLDWVARPEDSHPVDA
jgi:thiosulfate/3-mercaptopyruvate sulfurtransferase